MTARKDISETLGESPDGQGFGAASVVESVGETLEPGKGVGVERVKGLIRGAQDEGGQIVPGGVGHPGMLLLGHLSSNKAGGVSSTQSSNRPDVEEDVVVNRAGDQAVTDRNGEICGLRKLNAVRDLESDGGLRDRGWLTSYEKEMTGSDGSEDLNIKRDGAASSRKRKPLNRRRWLNVMISGGFQMVMERTLRGAIAIQMRVKRAGKVRGNGEFRGNHQSGIHLVDARIVQEKVHELGGRPIMERVVEENTGSATGAEILVFIAGAIANGVKSILEMKEKRLMLRKPGEFLSFHEVDGGWKLNEIGEDVIEQIMFDDFMEGVRMGLVTMRREGHAMRREKRVNLR